MEFNLKRLGLSSQSKILSITHAHCCDGTTCQICLSNVFKNLSCLEAKYDEVDSILDNVIGRNYDGYDFVFLTDISPQDANLLKNKNKIILLDHHNTAKYHHNPQENKYVIDNYCGTLLTKVFLEKYFDKKLSSLDNLVYLVNDYDLWKKNNAKSTFLNDLFYLYFSDKFKKRFYNGDTRFTPDEISYLRRRKIEFQKTLDDLEVYDLPKINACYFESRMFLNELCEKLLKMKYDVVFCKNPTKGTVSVRNKLPYLDVGEVLKTLGYGGGHHDAAGFSEPDFLKMKEKISNIEDRILEEVKRNRK